MNLLFAPPEIAATACLPSSQGLEESRKPAVHGGGDDPTKPGREMLDVSSGYQRAYNQLDNWWIVITVALPIYVLIKSRGFSTRASVNQTKSARLLRSTPKRNRPVLSLQTASSAVDVRHKDYIQSPNERGRNSATAIATDSFPSPRSALPGVCNTRTPLPPRHARSEQDHAEAKSVTNSPRNRSALVQASPQTRIRCLSASSATPITAHIHALPPPTNSPTRLRYKSLCNDHGDKRRFLRSARQLPLKAALFGSFSSFSLLPGIKWFVLFIGVNNGHVRDPEHDLALLEQILRQSSAALATIHLESVSGSDATRDKIKTVFTSLYLKAGCASNSSRILVFLSGLGDEAEQMCLLNQEFISNNDFQPWISEIHAQWNTPDISSLILADVCRPGKRPIKPADVSSNRTKFVRSCSPGQLAHVLAFKSVPWSCFLLAFFLASYDLYGSAPPGPMNFEAAFKHRMKQLGGLVSRVHDRIHERADTCKQCTDQGQKCDPPKEQTPEGESAGWDTLGIFGQNIVVTCPDSVQEIVSIMSRKMVLFRVLETSSSVSNVPSDLRREVAGPYTNLIERGATQPVLCVKV